MVHRHGFFDGHPNRLQSFRRIQVAPDMKKTLILVLLYICVVPAPAQLTRWTVGTGHVDMGRDLAVLTDPRGTLTIDAVNKLGAPENGPTDPAAGINRFIKSQQSILHFGFTNSIVW